MSALRTAKSPSRNTSHPVSAKVDAAAIDSLLTDLIAAHAALLDSVRVHREAMGRADLDGMAAAMARQNDCIERIGSLEKERNALAKSFGGSPAQRGPVSISDMARAVGGERGEALLRQANHLRALMQQIRQEQGSLGQAATQLAAHVDGLMRLVVQKLSAAGVYGRSGRVDVPRAALSVDMRS